MWFIIIIDKKERGKSKITISGAFPTEEEAIDVVDTHLMKGLRNVSYEIFGPTDITDREDVYQALLEEHERQFGTEREG